MKKLFLLIPFAIACTQTPDVEICKYKDDKHAAVSLTFDDGIIDHATLVAPHLNDLGLRGTFWIIGKNVATSPEFLGWNHISSMARYGHEISNHSWTHPDLTKLTPEEIEEEVRLCDEALAKALGGKKPRTFCFPFNAHNAVVDSICGAGRVGMRVFQEAQGQVNSHSTPESLRIWLQNTIDNGEWGVTMTHGIHNGWDQWNDEQVLWDFYEELAGRQDEVWVDTFGAVASYIQERDNCTLKSSYKSGILTIEPECTLDPSLFTERLTVRAKSGKKTFLLEIDPFGGPQTFDLKDKLCGKSIIVFGDSYVRNHLRPYTESWHYKVAERHHMRYYNYGINGSSVAFDRTEEGFGSAMVKRYETMVDADYVLVIAGHNDAGFVTRGEEYLTEFMKELDNLCSGLKEKYPHSKIGWVTPWGVDRDGFQTVIDAVKSTCARYGIDVLDAAQTSGINVNDPEFRKRYFQGPFDTAHLNADGHDLVVNWGDDFLKQL